MTGVDILQQRLRINCKKSQMISIFSEWMDILQNSGTVIECAIYKKYTDETEMNCNSQGREYTSPFPFGVS